MHWRGRWTGVGVRALTTKTSRSLGFVPSVGYSKEMTTLGLLMDSYKNGHDPFQRKVAEFLRPVGSSRNAGGTGDAWLGTSLGSVRKDNQDRVVIARVGYERRTQDNFVLAVLVDGIGGLPNGAEAAIAAASTFVASMTRNIRLQPAERLSHSANSANAAVYELFGGRGGSTLSAAFVGSSVALGVNVGDSRIFGVEADGAMAQLSSDDTLENYVNLSASMREGRNALLQYVGMGEGVEPHIIEIDRTKFARIILTSDGIHGVNGDVLAQVIRTSASSQDIVRKLLTLNDISGGADNGSVAALPTKEQFQERPNEGTSIRLLSPADRLEIWIPTSTVFQERSVASPLALDYEKLLQDYQGLLKRLSKPKKRSAKPRPAPSSERSSEDTSSPPLPLDEEKPEPKISFPEKRD